MKSLTTARRGGSGPPTTPATNARRAGPETRTTPIPLRPEGVAMAAMMSSSFIEPLEIPCCCSRRRAGKTSVLASRCGFALQHARDAPLLRDREYVVDEPVEHQPGREEEEENAENDRHDLHNLCLDRVGRFGIEEGLYPHGRGHEDREKTNRHSEPYAEKRIRRGEVVYPQHERRVTQLHAGQQNPIKCNKNRYLHQYRHAATERIDLL